MDDYHPKLINAVGDFTLIGRTLVMEEVAFGYAPWQSMLDKVLIDAFSRLAALVSHKVKDWHRHAADELRSHFTRHQRDGEPLEDGVEKITLAPMTTAMADDQLRHPAKLLFAPWLPFSRRTRNSERE